MKKFAIMFAFFSVILTSCSQLKETVMPAKPTPEPSSPAQIAPVMPISPFDPNIYVLKNDFVKFKQQLIPKPELEKVFQAQQTKVDELYRDLASLQKTMVIKPELVKAKEQMVSMVYFTQYAAEQQDIIKELQRQNLALRDISKDTLSHAAKIAELRSEAVWYKIKVALVAALFLILSLLGIIYLKISRRPATHCCETEEI